LEFSINLKFLSFEKKVWISKQSIQFFVITSVVLASTVISFWGSPRIYGLIVVLLAGLAVVIALIKQPNLGFLLVFLGGIFVPFSGPSGLNASILMVALMLGLWIADMLIIKRRFALIQSRITLPVLIFLLISVLALGMGQIPWFVFARQAPLTAQVGGFAIYIFSVGGMLLAAHLLQNVRWLEFIVWFYIGLCSLYILGQTVGFSFIDRVFHEGFTHGSMLWTWLIALTFSQIMYNSQLQPRVRNLLIVVMLLTLYVAVIQNFEWKSGWVPGMVSVFVLLAIKYRKLLIFSISFVVIGIIYISMDLIAQDDYSWGTRLDAWKIIFEIARINPILGLGFANYYWYSPLFPIRGWSVSFNSHSQYLDLIAQTGYLGLISFFWIFLTLGVLSWNLSKKLPGGFEKAYVYGALAGIVATLVAAFLGDWVLPFVYNVGLTGFRASILPWIFVGGVISLEQMLISKTVA
jgi:O-antigen ligase